MIMGLHSAFKYILLFLTLCSSCSCHKDNKDDIGKTILIYFAANNNLSSKAAENLSDLKEGYVPDYFEPGEAKNGNVLLVYMHQAGSVPQLLRISKDKYGDVNEEILKEYDEHNSVNDSVLRNVLNYANQLFPAEENGLILWSHGTGWLPEGFYSNPIGVASRSAKTMTDEEYHSYDYLVKSFGQENKMEMDIIKMAEALPIKYSYVIFDACLMGGVEVAYECKYKADYQIFSATEILSTGFPYKLIMESLMYSTAKLEDRLKETAKTYFDYYNNQTSDSQRSATVAVVKSSALDNLASCAKVIFSTGRGNIDTLTMSSIQGFFETGKHWFYDLDDFMSRIYTEQSHYSKFSAELQKTVLYSAHTDYFIKGSPRWNFPITKYSGLSTYIPNPKNSTLDSYYLKLSWNKAVEMIQ